MWQIPLFRIYSDDKDLAALTDAVAAGMNWAVGPQVEAFERGLAEFLGVEHVVTLNSGTSALHTALLAYGITQGDEVIVPSFTFIATANAPLFVGARPIFADIEPVTYGLDPEDVVERITPKTKAIIPVHYGGCPCRIRELGEIAVDHDLLLLEDAAEAFGARAGRRKVGTFGDTGVLSFCQNKVITTGEGGAVVTGEREIAERCRLIRSHGRLETCNYFSSNELMDYITLGYNFRLSNLSAALGLAQLQKADKIIRLRRQKAGYYRRELPKHVHEITVKDVPAGLFHVYQIFSVEARDRDDLITYLGKQGILTKIYFTPIHATSYYRNVLHYDCTLPVTDRIAETIVSLPLYPGISRSEIDHVVQVIKDFYQRRVCP